MQKATTRGWKLLTDIIRPITWLRHYVKVEFPFKLSICLFFILLFIREYLPNRWTYLNKSLHGDGNWSGIEHGGFHFLNFWGGLGWGPNMSLFARICPEWPSQNTIWRQNGERYQKSKTVLFWPDNGENRAKIRKGTAEILWRIYKKFTFLPAIFRLSSTLKFYNFYTVQDRGTQSAYEMLRMKRAF